MSILDLPVIAFQLLYFIVTLNKCSFVSRLLHLVTQFSINLTILLTTLQVFLNGPIAPQLNQFERFWISPNIDNISMVQPAILIIIFRDAQRGASYF